MEAAWSELGATDRILGLRMDYVPTVQSGVCYKLTVTSTGTYHIVEAIIDEDRSTDGVLLIVAPGHSHRNSQLDVSNLPTTTPQLSDLLCKSQWSQNAKQSQHHA